VADVEYWHKYWIIRSFLIMVEFLWWDFFQKIPGILIVRICIYMFLAVFGGAGIVYDRALGPFLTKNEQRIDEGIEMVKAKASYYFGLAAKQAVEYGKQQFFALMMRRSAAPEPQVSASSSSPSSPPESDREKTD
jgi:hypothetical protein